MIKNRIFLGLNRQKKFKTNLLATGSMLPLAGQ